MTTTQATATYDLTDAQYDTADRIVQALEQAADGLTPSTAGRKAKTTTDDAAVILRWLVANRIVQAEGNGARTRYYA